MLNFILRIVDIMSWKVIIVICIIMIFLFAMMLASVKVEVYQQPEEWGPDQFRPRNVNEYVVYL